MTAQTRLISSIKLLLSNRGGGAGKLYVLALGTREMEFLIAALYKEANSHHLIRLYLQFYNYIS